MMIKNIVVKCPNCTKSIRPFRATIHIKAAEEPFNVVEKGKFIYFARKVSISRSSFVPVFI